MNDPKRWLDDDGAEPHLRRLLARAPRARPLDPIAQSHARTRILKAALLPTAAAASLTLKTAAAFIAATTATATTLVVADVVIESHQGPKPVESVAPPPRRSSPRPALDPKPEPVAEAPDDPLPDPGPPPVRTFAPAPSKQGLAEESRLLERARALLGSDPAASLKLSEEHRRRFAKPQLAQERALIEIEALHRLGRNAEARSRAERLHALGPGGLYAERLERLIQRIERR